MSGLEVRPAESGDWERVSRVDELAFGYTREDDEPAIYRDLLELDRTRIAVLDGEDAGIASTYTLEMSVPGASRQPVAGLTWVGVLPTHRRRGVLTALMADHLESLHEQVREPVSALYAAEPAIYGRFGYGLASSRYRVSVPREYARLAVAPSADEPAPRFVDADDVRPQLALVADAVAAGRGGVIARTPGFWDRTFTDPPGQRNGGSALRTLLVSEGDRPRGFAIYRTKEQWDNAGPKGELDIREVMAVDAAAHRALWRVILGTDLIGTVAYWNLPTDDALLHQLVDVRRAQPTLGDSVFVRIVDVDRALTARTYATEVDVVLELDDADCPWNSGCWRLAGGPGGATCSPTTESPDLRLDTRVLGALYLGGSSLRSLADAGWVDETTSGALAATGRAFAAERAPWCQLVF